MHLTEDDYGRTLAEAEVVDVTRQHSRIEFLWIDNRPAGWTRQAQKTENNPIGELGFQRPDRCNGGEKDESKEKEKEKEKIPSIRKQT
jgi:hypothetical protein